jgi:polyhydroxybutyrate depolymerase
MAARYLGASMAAARLLGGYVAAVIALLALAGGHARAQAPPVPCARTPTPGDSTLTISSGGLQRTALVHVPPAPAGRPLPLLFALHGAAQDGAFFAGYTGFSTIADDERFIAVYPNATAIDGQSFWTINDHRPGSADDVGFISDLLTSLESTLCIDPTRVYATGVSNGGGMAARLACQLSTRIVAVAPVAGGYSSLPPCAPQAPVAMLEVHGSVDPTVPYGGGPGGAGSVPGVLAMWRRLDACPAAARQSRVAVRALETRWGPCAGGTQVAGLEIFGGGHQLPGGLPPDRGQNATLSTPWLIWSFLRAQRRRVSAVPARR